MIRSKNGKTSTKFGRKTLNFTNGIKIDALIEIDILKNEVISYDVKCISKGNSFDPSVFTSEALIDNGVIEKTDEIQIAHPGELVSYFKLKNGFTIKVNRNEISISGDNLDMSEKLFETIKVIFPKARLITIEYNFDEHFIDSSYPKSVFDKFVSVDGLELDVFRYKKNDILFLLYNCQPSQMHLKIESKINLKKFTAMDEVDFQEVIDIKTINESREVFVDSFLK